MSINPSAIISNKAQTLASSLGDAIESVDTAALNEQFDLVSRNVFDASSKINIQLPDSLNIDTAGLQNRLTSLADSIPSLANLDDPGAIFPPSLNQFANGFGSSLASKAQNLVDQVVPLAGSLANGIDSAVADLESQINGFTLQSVEQEVEQFVEKFTQSVRGSLSAPEREPSAPGVTIKNPLRQFQSYNCIFSLGVLTANSANNPSETYIKRGADFTILRSGGGGIDAKRIQTYYDSIGAEAGNLEYFIDDFEMTSLLSPNNKTGATQAINFSFTVKEPYSMGLFLQSLQSAAFDAGFQNYLQAPYILELDFIGWDDNGGKPVSYSNRKIPFKLTTVEFDVESGGSTYKVNCIPWNEQTFQDDVMTLQDTVSITGNDLVECLSTGEQGLSTIINDKLKQIAEQTCSPASDYYLVRFPTSRSGDIGNISPTATENRATISDAEALSSRRGEQAAEVEEDGLTTFFRNIGIDTSSNSLLQSLKGDSVTNLNAIGASSMISEFQAGGDSPFGLGLYTYDEEANVYKRNGVEMTISDTNRTFKFTQGTPITKVIEEMVLVSEYGRSALQRVDNKGEISWFKIEAKCYIVPDSAHETETGESPKIYVFDVVPYKVDASRFSAPSQANSGLIEKARHCVKTYNYIYSGQNEDVLGFEIKFNAAFFQAIRMDMGQLQASDVVNDRESITVTPRDPALGRPTPGQTVPEGRTRSVVRAGNFNGGSYNKQYGEAVAKMFHNALMNSKADLITAELEIWGDPYFIPDSGVGNWTAPRGGSKNITATGSIDHQRNEVDVVINFRTPVDYNNDGTMFFPGQTIAVDSFSGVYQVITVNSRISGNKFTQTLELVRRRNQSTEGISNDQALVELPSCQGVNTAEVEPTEEVGTDPQENTTVRDREIVAPTGSNGSLATIRSSTGKTTQVAAIMAPNFQALIDELEGEYGYEIRSLGGYVQRNARGSTSPSYHASGLAIDINATQNPMIKPRPEDAPEPYTDMPEGGTGSLMKALAEKHGLGWGGDWRSSIDAMHFSAAQREGGSLDWPRNGLIPGGNEPPETPPATVTAPEQRTPEPSVETVRRRPASGQNAQETWDARYAATHNPDGTPKASYVAASGSRVSGVDPVANDYSLREQQYQSGQFGESTLRPYFPTDALDNLYDVKAGNKIRAIANFYTRQGVEVSTPVTTTSSGVTYNEFGDEVPVSSSTPVSTYDEFGDEIEI